MPERKRGTDDAAASPIQARRIEKIQLQDALEVLKESLLRLRAEIESAEGKGDKKLFDKLAADFEKGIFEAKALEERIRAADGEIEALRQGEMAGRRESALKEAEGLAKEKKSLQARISEIDKRGVELLERFTANVPRKRVQTSSGQFVKLTRVVHDKRLVGFKLRAGGLAINASKDEVVVEEFTKNEEAVIEGLPERIKAMTDAGWTLAPGQEVKDEPLTLENSREIASVRTPDVFYEII